jgi:hypothetical protein
MEVRTVDTKGNIRYSKKFKQIVVEKKHKENWSWRQVRSWVIQEYGITIHYKTMTCWQTWYDDSSVCPASFSSANTSKVSRPPPWRQWELEEVQSGKEIGLSYREIAECMNEDSELNPRHYTPNGIASALARKDLNKSYNSTAIDIQECKDLLKDVGQSLVELKSTHCIKVKCDNCGYEWVKGFTNIKKKIGCSMCIIPPNSYHEVYVIEFYTFGNPSVKVGISVDYYNKRRESFPEHKVIAVYKTTYKKAKELENLIKEQYGIYRTTPPELQGNGMTECYDISMTNEINKIIKEQLYG